MKKVKALSIDAEFTSWDMRGGDMIALGAVEILEDYSLGRELILYFRPEGHTYYTEKAREIHGISLWKSATFPKAADGLVELTGWAENIEWEGEVRLVWFGTWAFDPKWVRMTFEKQDMKQGWFKLFPNHVDENVLKLAKAKLKHIEFKNWKLPTIAKHWSIKIDHHEALSDARATAIIWCNLKQNIDTWTGELF